MMENCIFHFFLIRWISMVFTICVLSTDAYHHYNPLDTLSDGGNNNNFNWTSEFMKNSMLMQYLVNKRSEPSSGDSSDSDNHHHSLSRPTRRTCANDSVIITNILGESYNANKIPGGSVTVEVEVWVQEITTISDITSDFQLDIYISELWLDPELKYEKYAPCKHNLSLSYKNLDRIWTPNSCFINSKEADIHESPFRNVFLMIYPNGTVWTNYRIKLTGPCTMNLVAFPFDVVVCNLTFESFNYNTDEVKMKWSSNGVKKIRENIELADYALEDININRVEVPYPAGYWHELTMSYVFRRRYGWYILQAYLPTYLTIFISWIAFCLGASAIPARTMLGVNSLLAMTFQFDVWMLSCMTFVFCSLLELAAVGFLSRDTSSGSVSPKKVKKKKKRGFHSGRTSPGVVAANPDTLIVPPQPYHASNVKQRLVASDNVNTTASNTTHYNTMNYNSSSNKLAGGGSPLQPAFRQMDDHYDYRPPGFGLGLNNSLAKFILNTGPSHSCSCQNSFGYQNLPTDPASSFPEKISLNSQQNRQHHAALKDKPEKGASHKLEQMALRIDRMSCIIFPALFGLFNIGYWWYYLGGG